MGEHRCQYCGRVFEHLSRRRGIRRYGTNLTDHYVDCDVRRLVVEEQRRLELRRARGAP